MLLEGGCRVVGLREGPLVERGGVRAWTCADRESGAKAISLRVLEMPLGLSPGMRNAECDDVLYVLRGRGAAYVNGWRYDIEPDTGIYAPPGATLCLRSVGDEPIVLVSSRCPDAGPKLDLVAPLTEPLSQTAAPPRPTVRLTERQAEVTGDRWYRVLVDDKVGSASVTQFVGSIPPGRAPDHYHQYEEVLCILAGRGRMWAGKTNTPIEAGSCVYLPRGQVHCVENEGDGELRLLGVFYPAGSPAVRYSAD
jgi:mannose-6-phosphate isomerase-like protein (cupin superfamily)